MTTCYRIKDWHELYETHETRKLKNLRWVPVSNKHEGKGFRRISAHPQRCELFAAWMLMLQVASKVQVRGVLADKDGPLDALDLAAKTGYPAEIFDLAFRVLIDPKIGWVEVCEWPIVERGTVEREKEAKSPGSDEKPGENPDAVAELNRREGKGTEPTPPVVSGKIPAAEPAIVAPAPAAATIDQGLRTRVDGVNRERLVRAVAEGDLIGVVGAFGGDLTGDRAGQWQREAGDYQLGVIVALLGWCCERRAPLRQPSGLLKAKMEWHALGGRERGAIVERVMARYGLAMAEAG